jgi:hypothetical protein
MKLKEVKKHFKNAKDIVTFGYGIYGIVAPFYNRKGNIFDFNGWSLWHKDFGFAEIISYKKPKFEYGDKVVASDYKDFSISVNCRYACKNLFNRYVVFTDYDYDYAFVYKYIKKTI